MISSLPLVLKLNFHGNIIRCWISCTVEWQRRDKVDVVCMLSTLVHLLVVYYLPVIR